ncbi:MAG: P1 family peptidase [Acidimicrobiales bacterium]
MLTEIEGIRVGHWTDDVARTGCTVVLFPEGTVASGEVRGGAPATREFALLEPGRLVERLDAIVLSGGSAFGLASCDGVMDHLAARGVGFETSAGPVPIVVGMCLFDLGEGDGTVRPGPNEGRAAAEAATDGVVALGRVGAATGATVSKWRGPDHVRPGALVGAVARSGDLVVAALVAVNASGDIDDGSTVAAVLDGSFVAPQVTPFVENTTIGVVATNASLTKAQCHLVAQSAHDGFGRAIVPAHTVGDGDAIVVAATGELEIDVADVAAVRLLACVVVESAIRTTSGSA